MTPLAAVVGALVAWLAIGAAGVVRPRDVAVVRVLFPLGAGVAIVLAWAALAALGKPAEIAVLPLGLPGLPFHLRLDALSAFFLVLLGSASAAISLFSSGYFRSEQGAAPGRIGLEYHVFLAAMGFVLIANDAYLFMIAWETMAVASYFLVT
ncbi:MAG: hydrogenase 4 subunit B, partial [Proteobacteria bacterium]|nr:hydrogenase 4 subunit B [Pseudomonadota bacterium]